MDYWAGPGLPRRVAMLSVHTSPLAQPGGGDAGGMNVYVLELSRSLAQVGVEVEIFTRATEPGPERVEVVPGVTVHALRAGPLDVVATSDLEGYLGEFTAAVLHRRPPGWFDVVHGHYWLSGLVGRTLAQAWDVPFVQSMHTLARVTRRSLSGTAVSPRDRARVAGERVVVDAADVMIANTDHEAADLVSLYDADPLRVRTVHPGVDLDNFAPPAPPRAHSRAAARRALQLPVDAMVLLFAGRIQPLKGPDIAVRAVADVVAARPELRGRVRLAVLGAPSGAGLATPTALPELAQELGIADLVRFEPPVDRERLTRWFHASDLTLVPSRAESFGLVALESQASGTPVLASDVGGLRTAVQNGRTGILVPGHDPADWAAALSELLSDPVRRDALAAAAVPHAMSFTWHHTAEQLLDVYNRLACVGIGPRPQSVSDPLAGRTRAG